MEEDKRWWKTDNGETVSRGKEKQTKTMQTNCTLITSHTLIEWSSYPPNRTRPAGTSTHTCTYMYIHVHTCRIYTVHGLSQ